MKPTTAYNQYSTHNKEEWSIIRLLTRTPGLYANEIYRQFGSRRKAMNALHSLENKKTVYNENFRWYIKEGVE